MIKNKKINNICILRRKIEKLINEYFPFNELIEIPGDLFWCNYLIHERGIYLLFNEKNIIYIGLSNNLGSRLNTHFHNIDYGNDITSIGLIRLNYEDWDDFATIEAYLIHEFNPIYNKNNQHFWYRKSIPSDFNMNKIITKIKELGLK